jgi:hypothetical protein
LLLILGRKGSPDYESDQHADGGREKHEPPAKAVDEGGGAASNGKIENLESSIDEILRSGVGDADAVEHESKIRRDELVTTPLDDEAKDGNDEQSMTVSL